MGKPIFWNRSDLKIKKSVSCLDKIPELGFDVYGQLIYYIQSIKYSSTLKIMDLNAERKFLAADSLTQHNHVSFFMTETYLSFWAKVGIQLRQKLISSYILMRGVKEEKVRPLKYELSE